MPLQPHREKDYSNILTGMNLTLKQDQKNIFLPCNKSYQLATIIIKISSIATAGSGKAV